MDLRPSPFFLGLIVVLNVLSAAQDTNEEIPEGASTLAFVFDVTGSMYDDLVQVIEGASKILETSLSRPQRPLYNFALVPFHDPEIGPITITTDPKKFQDELRELYVQGGGDCPEMSIGAIKIALEISLPGSYIYVFTDARSKDYKLTHDVLQLIQQKQSQVVFVLTGDCDDRSHIGYKVYEEIASTSSGQVFHLDKKQVNEVLKWVEEAVQSSKVHLLSTDHQNGLSNTWQIPFDPSLKEVTVALSGPAPNIEIRNSQGKLIGIKEGLSELLHIPNSAKVLNLKDPAPGMWTIKVMDYEGRHSVRISGLSTIDFRAGFSRRETLDFKMTSSRPVQGIPTFILLNTTALSPPARADRLELLSITGDVMKTLPIRYFPDRRPYGIWNITEFVPPKEAFFLRVTGYDRDGFVFQRVSSVSYSSIVPEAPRVSMPTHTPGYYLQKGSITCFVDSLIPYTLRFTREGLRLGVDQIFRESANASWGIPQVSLKDEGFYECIAISSAGTGRAQTFLDVSEPPPAITVPSNATVSPGANVVLTCLVASTVRFNLTWQRGDMDARLDRRMRVTANLSLEIQRVTPDDVGWYTCIAANEGGVSTSRVYLNVQEPPVVTVDPRNQTFRTGQEIWIRCSAKGYPLPMVVWTHNDMHRMTPDGTLVIRKTGPKDAGTYGCLASNVAGTDTQTAIVSYIESPQVTVPHSDLLIGLGQTTILECRVTGVPHPDVLWYKGQLPSAVLSMDPQQGTLSIQQTRDTDAGEYTCVAINSAGSAQGYITLDVGSAPQFTRKPSDLSADIGTNITLPCHAQGHPKPQLSWRREDNVQLSSQHRSPTSNALKMLNYLWVEDETTYVCEAQNHFGKIQAKAKVTVTGLGMTSEKTVLILHCHNNKCDLNVCMCVTTCQVTSSPYVTVRRDGSLHIERVGQQDGGQYTCLAENVVGSSNRTTILNVYVMPTIQHGPQVFSTIEGTPISLPCHAHGVPKPDVTWSKLLDLSGSVFSLGEDGSLYIVSPSGEESGEFVCTATNAAGYSSRKVQLTVYGKSPFLLEMSVKVGDDVTLPCEVESVPPPIITWAKDKQLISPFSNRHIRLSSGSMRITETRVTDIGIYVCVATNIAGNFTQMIKLSVLGKRNRSHLFTWMLVGHAIDLPCVAQGVPEPSVSWLKDGSVLLDGSQYKISDEALTLNQVGLMDEGVYTCMASNIAGQDEATIQLHVSEPPFNSPLQERVANQQIAFPCPAKGTPEPVIKWFRNGQELTGNEPGVSILEDGTLLILASVSPLDNGEYTCIAVNDAGTTEKKYQLKVNVPPDIRDNGLLSNVSVVMNQPTNLVCDVTGTPVPVITWYKEGAEVSTVTFTENHMLLKAAVVDAGRYTCKAINIAGSTERDFYLDVLVPPTIIGTVGSRDLSVVLNQEINLECRVKGDPFPTIQWYKDRKPVFLGDPNIEVLNRGQQLKIKSARLGDQARYQCSATNAAGKQSKDFNLSIFVPPSIKGGNMTSEVTVLLGNLVTLECEVRGVPLPAITWYKKGEVILSSRHAQYVDRGQFLKISSAQVSDAGQYTCKVTSVAGTAEKVYDVLVPPVVDGASETTDATVILNNILELECYATGTPTPTIRWLKDGVAVRQGEGVRIMSNGRRLVISRAQVSDTALFHCVATNEAGEQEREFKVSVHGTFVVKFYYFFFNICLSVPPTIRSTGPAERSVVLHMSISLQCVVSGTPPPTVTWYKDGRPLTSAAGVKILSRGQVLEIDRAQVSDAGLYKCVAINVAGSTELTYSLQVYVPPSISSKGGMITVVVNDPVRLECEASGVPVPAISWMKDGRPLSTGRKTQILNEGRLLRIQDAQVADTGRYTCIAVNVAGQADRKYDVNVHVPPTIIGQTQVPENVSVVVKNPVVLTCEASGMPPPSITWLKDGQPISTLQVMSNGRFLQINGSQVADTGRYSCLASNSAGDRSRHFNLNVLESLSPKEVKIKVNNTLTLECEAQAIPTPTLVWYKDANGRIVQIKHTQVSDTGRYTCVATNIAGEDEKDFDVNIQVPPRLDGPAVERVVETISNPVTFACDATGIPPPSLTWLKNGRVIENSESLEMHILSGGSKLQISRSQLSDSGTYTCVASNVEGKARKNYHLTIQVPPNIRGSELPSEMSVLLNDSIQLVCRAEGNPTPEIQWLKDGKTLSRTAQKNIKISPDGSTLTVTAVHTSDSGKYTCVATNQAGEEDRIFNLNVYVPPLIQGNGPAAKELTAVLDSSINIECVASGSPPPQLNWLKNGLPLPVSSQIRLLSAGQVLRIARAQVSDGGSYTCVASNRAGVDNRHYSLQVYVPPSLDGAGSTEEVTVVSGNTASFICIADGMPSPTITWLKNGAAMPKDAHLSLLNQNSTLQIFHARVNHTGRYTCTAHNQAGDASRHFSLKVLDPPRINGSGVPAEVSVVVNHVLELVCEADGIPLPTLTWLKDGRPLPQTDSIRLLRDGEVLRVASAQVENTGRYTCLATSPAGDDDKEFLVRVHVPPNIAGDRGVQDVSVLQNRQVTLECKSDAVPPPTLTWLKDGTPLKMSPRVRVLSSGRYLQINNAELGDGAQYTCVASNVAGETRRHFNLIPPVIKDGPQSVSVHINQPVVLECVVNGVPTPRITWRKHGAILAGNNPRFGEDGSLHILSAQVTDTGRYLCMATSQAGTDRKRVDLQVYVPPSITEGPTSITVTVNVQTTLSCEATGIPKPSVRWTKNDQLISLQSVLRLLSSGSLVVIAPTVEDTALYECVVSNEAGQESRAIQLTVHVPPSIADEATELVVSRLSPVVIGCTASGVPHPVLYWSKDGLRLTKDGESYTILPSGPLQITAADLSHSGRYSCVAKNAAGTAQRHIQLTVHEPPVIQSHPSTLDVILNNHVTLPCRATGSPRPTITWQKEGINIFTAGGDFTVLPNGGLQISKARVEDSGTYMCVAQNPAGTALGKTKLRVQVPPVITSDIKVYTVALDASVTLQCHSEGFPTPSINWYKNGQLLSESVRQRVLSTGALQIAFAQPGDTGRYTCTAANVAGTTSLEMIPPSIREGNSEVSVVENTQALLTCVADGVPQPNITWEKDDIALSDTAGEYTVLPTGELLIDSAQPEDSGSYTCVATNSIGQDSRTIGLSIHTHPAFTELLGDVALNKGERLLLTCGVTGIPPPKITWAFNNNIIPAQYDHVNGHSELVIERVSKDDSGSYSCVAENTVGSIKSLGFVYVKEPPIIDGDVHSNQPVETVVDAGSTVVLNCQAEGEPVPVIEWSRQGWPLLGNERITMLNNSSLRFSSAQKEDTAEYQCVARNLLGSVLVRVTLTVRVHGGFSEWMEWGACSVSCGTGVQKRLRQCNNPFPANGGRHCIGSATETRSCQGKPCPGGPQKARGSIIGNINDMEFGIAILNATISNNFKFESMLVYVLLNHPGPAMRKLISILNPIYWTTAQELGEAVNGYTLTDGIFRRETQVEFATGEILRMTHVARGLDSDGALLLDIVVEPPSLNSLNIIPFYTLVSVPYSWNHTITYRPSKGKMPYLVQTLHASAINLYDFLKLSLSNYDVFSSSGERSNQCPSGFQLDPAGPYCSDENECADGNPCSHACHNAIGTYYCSCPRGLTISADGRTCQDIDECSLGGHMCHDGQDCENTIGSYRCVMRCGRGFRRTADGLSCSDVNECQESNPCHQHCLNTIGSFRCACEPGYQLRNRRCIDINECRQRVCRSDQQCKNTRGGYTCIDLCPTGMTKGGNGTCIDIDECHDGTHQCRHNQICENTRGSYHCTCPRGYRSQGVGRPCLDINECELVPVPCAYQCVNSPGSYKCLCPPGLHLLGDGKSCAGLERLPGYESFSYGYRTSQSSSDRRSYQQRYHSLTSQSYHSYVPIGGRHMTNRPNNAQSRSRRDTNSCPLGFKANNGQCLDINECEQRDACQHECMNTPGSHRCLCPSGYHLMTNGKTCQDIDECLEQNIQCGANRMCFNMRGSYQCIDTPCPPNYQRDPNCPPNDLECALSPYALEYKLLSLPFGIAANQDLIRLVAYTQDGVVHPRTSFLVVDEDTTLPFALRDENLKGVLFTTRPLREPRTYRMKVRALSYSADGGIEYQTTFIVYIAVSAYPY
uniref:Hemicentin-1 n=1 Tax=Cyprinus carpio TaxID=7962 RepID=A0A8C1K3P7_CYPCA